MALIGRFTVWLASIFAAAFVVTAVRHFLGWELCTLTGFVSVYMMLWLFPSSRVWERF